MRFFSRSLSIAAAGLCAGVVLTTGLQAFAADDEKAAALPLEDIEFFADVYGSIKNFYVDDVPDSELMENAIKGMVEGLDPHSSYLDFKGFKDMEESTTGEFGGLGKERFRLANV